MRATQRYTPLSKSKIVVTLRNAVRIGQTRRQAAKYSYYPIFRRSSPPLIAFERG
jgi:hypothetical protein